MPLQNIRFKAIALCAVLLAVLAGLSPLFARHGHAAAPQQSDAELTRKECGACHYPYRRDWLPAYSWKFILDHLDDHFGENAMLDQETRDRIAAYLVGGRSTDIPIRVTHMDWWLRVHGGPSIYAYALQRGFSASNCEKCHR